MHNTVTTRYSTNRYYNVHESDIHDETMDPKILHYLFGHFSRKIGNIPASD